VIRLSQLIGQPIVARADGQRVGSIQRLLLDPGRGAISAALLEAPVGGALVLDWSKVVAVSQDAVLVEAVTATRHAEGDAELRLVSGQLELVGKRVLTAAGDELGELEDVEFDEHSGRVVRLHVPDQVLAPVRLVALGPDALIITPPA
jgi:sporulation protein YlmC with PRC-barrel domain